MTTVFGAIAREDAQRIEIDHLFGLSDIVERIGQSQFADRLLTYFDGLIGADHCSIFQLKDYELTEVSSACRADAEPVIQSDLTSYEVKRQLSVTSESSVRVDFINVPYSGDCNRYLQKRQRVLLSVRKDGTAYCVRILRPHDGGGVAVDALLETANCIAGTAMSVVAKHVDLTTRRPNLTPALCSLPEIEGCILVSTNLSKREGEVCARILYGLSSCGIALDLGIGKESVMTYRKRAYQRLGIGSQRELLMWYLTLWSDYREPCGLARTELN